MKKPYKKDLRKKLVALYDPLSSQAEYFRTIKTNVEMANLDITRKTLLITSPTQDSGKTLIASNLAATYAQYDQKVLLIDLDLRKPSVGPIFPQAMGSPGITGLLDQNRSLTPEEVITQINQTNLYVLGSGARTATPYAIVNSKKLLEVLNQLQSKFDRIILDTPPILPVSDALVLSKWANSCLLVVRNNYSKKEEIKKALKQLQDTGTNLLGFIFNDAQSENKNYYYRESDV